MKAQKLYNLREEYGYCSGTDLHEFFQATVGDPSPSGRVEVPTDAAMAFMVAGVERQYYPGDGVVGDAWRGQALLAIVEASSRLDELRELLK